MNANEEKKELNATTALFDYYKASNDIWRIIATFFGQAFGDNKKKENTEDFYTRLDENSKNIELIKKNKQIMTEMVLCRIVDNFLTYVTCLLRSIMKERKETVLSDKDKIDIKLVINANSLEELYNEIIENRVNRLSYMSVDDLSEYLREKLGFPFFEDDITKSIVIKTVEARNIFVHNRAVMNRRYLSRTGGSPHETGTILSMNPSDLIRMNSYFDKIARDIDNKASNKFCLSRNSHVDM